MEKKVCGWSVCPDSRSRGTKSFTQHYTSHNDYELQGSPSAEHPTNIYALPEKKKLNTDVWYDEKTLNWIKASCEKMGKWEYKLIFIN